MNQATNMDALRRSLLGAELDPPEAKLLAQRMGQVALRDGELLIAEGDLRRTLFLLVAGGLNVIRAGRDGEEALYQMRVGECAGTRAFIDGSPRAVGLRALGDTEVLTLEPDAFEALIETHPWLVYKVMRAFFRITHAHLMHVNFQSEELRNYLLKRRY